MTTLAQSARGLRKVHLRDRLIEATDKEDKDKLAAIEQIISREAQRSTWRAIKKVTKEPNLGAITWVEKQTKIGTTNKRDLEGMAAEIQRVTE